MRFDSARAAGLTEDRVDLVQDDYAQCFEGQEAAALALTDLIIQQPRPPTPEQIRQLKEHFSDAEIAEIMLAVGLFLGMSKVLITLGLEPDEMPVTVLPTPGSV